MNPRILIIGLVWPEPTSSAAGWRMLQLIAQLQLISNDVHFACAASKSESSCPLEEMGVKEHAIVLNDASFDDFVTELQPKIVMYDRFMIEEQYGWRVKQSCPDVVTILDTEDLHFVRKARTASFKSGEEVNYETADCYRELSAIYRCDLSIIISKWEYDLLIHHFNIPKKQLIYLPFIEDELNFDDFEKLPSFSNREHFMFIGNFIHEPNYATVLQLKKMWPQIKKQLPKASLHIYGAYAPAKVLQLHNAKEDFYIKGKCENVNATMQQYKVLIAPIPFGAGLKGKFIDGFKNKLPSVTFAVGSEGIAVDDWGGFIAENEVDFINNACVLYTSAEVWDASVEIGRTIINENFSKNKWDTILGIQVQQILKDSQAFRSNLFVQKILWQNSFQASKYMSLWIQEKNNKS